MEPVAEQVAGSQEGSLAETEGANNDAFFRAIILAVIVETVRRGIQTRDLNNQASKTFASDCTANGILGPA
jgi:hypothetical protein